MEKGPAKVRRRTTADISPISYALKCTKAQIAILDSFYRNDTFSGVEPFTYTHPRTGQSVVLRFTAKPSWNHVEKDEWSASVQFEVMP